MKKFFSKGNRCLERHKEVRKRPKSLTNTPGVYMQHVIGRGIWLFGLAFNVVLASVSRFHVVIIFVAAVNLVLFLID
jgi:hypothetical protein